MVYYVTKFDKAVVILLSSEECHCGFIAAWSFKHAFQSLYFIPVRRKMQTSTTATALVRFGKPAKIDKSHHN